MLVNIYNVINYKSTE